VAYKLGAAQILVGLTIMAALWRRPSCGIGILSHGTSTVATLPHLIRPRPRLESRVRRARAT
jgi:uncharacterized membrane protein YkgB